MDILVIAAIFLAAIIFQYLTIYISYLPVSRKQATQKQMHKTALVVTGYSLLVCVLLGILEFLTPISTPNSISAIVTAVLVYQQGRSKLNQSNKQAWASAGIFTAIYIALVAGVVCLMITNNAFRETIIELMETEHLSA